MVVQRQLGANHTEMGGGVLRERSGVNVGAGLPLLRSTQQDGNNHEWRCEEKGDKAQKDPKRGGDEERIERCTGNRQRSCRGRVYQDIEQGMMIG